MTLAETMDRLGLDATVEEYGEAFKASQYDLWHANAGARTHDNDLWHVYGLPQGDHTLRIVTRADADARSGGRTVAIVEAVVYRARQAGLPGQPPGRRRRPAD
jgi:hypothetical protein